MLKWFTIQLTGTFLPPPLSECLFIFLFFISSLYFRQCGFEFFYEAFFLSFEVVWFKIQLATNFQFLLFSIYMYIYIVQSAAAIE